MTRGLPALWAAAFASNCFSLARLAFLAILTAIMRPA